MITITHEGSGPYIERTIIDYGGIRSHTEIPEDAAFEAIVSSSDGESLDDLKERIEMLEGQLEEEEEAHRATRKDLKDAGEEIRDLNARLDESDPAQSMRQEIARLKGLNEGYSATIRRQESDLRAALHEVRTLKAKTKAKRTKTSGPLAP